MYTDTDPEYFVYWFGTMERTLLESHLQCRLAKKMHCIILWWVQCVSPWGTSLKGKHLLLERYLKYQNVW